MDEPTGIKSGIALAFEAEGKESTRAGLLHALSAAATATEHAIDECVQVLEDAGHSDAAILLRRTFDRWPAGHVCAFTHNGYCLCGASL